METELSKSEKMRLWHASLTEEQKSIRSAKLSKALRGQKRTSEQCQRNSEAQKGKKCSEDHKAKVRQGLSLAYEEGRRLPWNGGIKLGPRSEEVKKAISDGGREHFAENPRTAWNKGIPTGPMPQDVRDRISRTSLSNPRSPLSPEKLEEKGRKISEALTGKKDSQETKTRKSSSARRAYLEGRKSVSPKAGYGKGSFYNSPYQGVIWMRSSSEVQRALELDSQGLVWFHEVQPYRVTLDSGEVSSYTPDFWVVHGLPRRNLPSVGNVRLFLKSLDLREVHLVVEDVKGWWGPNHKTFKKISLFQTQYSDLDFQIVIREGMHVPE